MQLFLGRLQLAIIGGLGHEAQVGDAAATVARQTGEQAGAQEERAGTGATGLALTLQVAGGVPSGAVSGAGTLQLVQITNTAGQSWLAVEATGLSFGLEFGPLAL